MSERRKIDEMAPAGRSGEDRRIIERLSNPRIHAEFKQIQFWVRSLGFLFLFFAVARLGRGIYDGKPLAITTELFFAVVKGIFAALLFRYAHAIGLYLKNESLSNFEIAFERQQEFWKSTGIFAFIFVVVGLAFFL
jgi:hypothetical protein